MWRHRCRSHGEKLTEKHIDQTVKHPEEKTFWGCYSHSVFGPLRPVDGMMNSKKYAKVGEEQYVREMMTSGTTISQHDLAPCHTSKVVTNILQQNRIQVLDWSGNFRDLNPTENLWSVSKSRLRKMDCTTKTKLIESMIEVWYRDEQIKRDCQNLIDSMPRRVQQVIQNKSGHTSY